ncbi:MAG: hypothetical protein OXG35_00465 [Acidobacteria bacterium]|nr:hypothetical protein [Acidobacteriota bacterium]
MGDWLSTPLIVTASLAVIIAVVKVIRWTATVDLKLDQFTRFAKEVRDDIKQIFLRLPPVPVVASSPLQLTAGRSRRGGPAGPSGSEAVSMKVGSTTDREGTVGLSSSASPLAAPRRRGHHDFVVHWLGHAPEGRERTRAQMMCRQR